jgi:phage shock protein E
MSTLRLAVFAGLALASCSQSAPSPPSSAAASAPSKAPATKDPATARAWIAAGATVVDVRTVEEFADAHLPQAVNIPVDDLAQRLAEVDQLVRGNKAAQVVLYCGSGARAARAKQLLDAAGYTQVVNGGGYSDLR